MASLETTLSHIEALITGRDQIRNFDMAYRLAQQATQDFPAQPIAWLQLILTANLTDRHDIALIAQAKANAKCSAWTDIDRGDCERDHALYHIHHHKPVEALQHIIAAREFHASDADRSALLDSVEGEWWYMLGEYGTALKYFLDATAKWETLAERSQTESNINPPCAQWRFNSDRRLLKAIVALRGPQGKACELYARLLQRLPDHGSPDIAWRLRLVMTGRLGNWFDTQIESPCCRRFLTKLIPLLRQRSSLR